MIFCRTQRRFRAWAAAVAAYGLVLQMLLAGIAATQASAADAARDDIFIICTGSGEGSSADHRRTGAPGHQHDCGMCVLTLAPTARIPADIAVIFRLEAAAGLSWSLSAPARVGKHYCPKSAQGPPAVA